MNEQVLLGGGCFWCTEAIFLNLRGVVSVTSGYAGGTTENPTYEEICAGTTGHAEVISVIFDPNEISFTSLLSIFFATHDPTTLNKQGADTGTQYRSVIFYTNEKQKGEATTYIESLNASSSLGSPIVTEIAPYTTFYEAEDYHKNYYANNKEALYCQLVINPKLEKAQKEFAQLLKDK